MLSSVVKGENGGFFRFFGGDKVNIDAITGKLKRWQGCLKDNALSPVEGEVAILLDNLIGDCVSVFIAYPYFRHDFIVPVLVGKGELTLYIIAKGVGVGIEDYDGIFALACGFLRLRKSEVGFDFHALRLKHSVVQVSYARVLSALHRCTRKNIVKFCA